MLRRKETKAIQKSNSSVFKQLRQLSKTDNQKLSRLLVVIFLHIGHKGRRNAAKAGFVLPTVALLLLVVALVVAAILIRTGSRTNQVIGAREEQVIYNAATPAIERAKAKLEYLFLKDKRFPGGPPSDKMLMSMLTNNPNLANPSLTTTLNPDPYTLPDEQRDFGGRLDINGDGIPDPAWAYKIDVDGDSNEPGITDQERERRQEIVVYSITLNKKNGNVDLTNANESQKANAMVVRNGPLSTINPTNPVCASLTQATPVNPNQPTGDKPTDESAWEKSGNAVLRKTFQVNAIVISNKAGTSRTVATLEFQQDRQLDRGNKWGAWFRNDMEIFPGNAFRWNGAMYTAGNLMVGGNSNFTSYLISAPNSCFYSRDASEITVTENLQNPENPQIPNFQGQIISGSYQAGGFGGSSSFHVMKPDNSVDPSNTLDQSKDSVKGQKSFGNTALDPVALFTQDISKSRGGTPANTEDRDPNWESNSAASGQIGYFFASKRIFNRSESAPFIDDTYRADDRYGPKPSYGRNKEVLLGPGKLNGNHITDATDQNLLTKNTTDPLDTEFANLGWDGYWERRAAVGGLRLIVGERLELGNTNGWNNAGATPDSLKDDPLYPAVDPVNSTTLTNEARQRRTWRDNLAAVQATAVYHRNVNTGQFPVACLATTAHPGTTQTIEDSKNFNYLTAKGFNYTGQPNTNPGLISDFFTGKGTNGWEYTIRAQGDFTNSGSDLRKALQNLAYFAGDHVNANQTGAFPPTQEGGGLTIHPYPLLTMWGNFSNLARAISPQGNNSIADQSYMHTAGCTLGMLAYNINHFENYTYNDPQNPNMADSLRDRMDGENTTVADVLTVTAPLTPPTVASTDPAYTSQLDTYRSQFPAYITALNNAIKNQSPDNFLKSYTTNAGSLPDTDRRVQLAKLTAEKVQIQSDRRYGFANPSTFNYEVKYIDTTKPTDPFNKIALETPGASTIAAADRQIQLPCNPADYNNFGFPVPGATDADRGVKERRIMAAAIALCPRQAKYPSLRYLFPLPNSVPLTPVPNEPYTTNPYINSLPGRQFQVVNLNNVQVVPKPASFTAGNCNDTNWCLPTNDQQTTSQILDNPGASRDFQITLPAGGNRYVSVIDNALFNGREMMTVRVLDLDLNLLRLSFMGNDTWLPSTGIVYAFREDAVREDAIARPRAAGVLWSACDTNAKITDLLNPSSAMCRMNVNVNNPQDPPISGDTGISIKPVDYYPDPDRRPYGFRLRNGKNISRPGDKGLSFISDNPVYIQGDFNYHSTDGNSNNLEEFTQTLDINNWTNFYNRTTLDDRFSRPASDTWRPAEILADAVTVLSENFQEGNIASGIQNDSNPTNTKTIEGKYSFRAMNGPTTSSPGQGWVREDGTISSTNLPIKISRNGNPLYCNTTPNPVGSVCTNVQEYNVSNPGLTYRAFGFDYRADYINQASPTRVNATIISGTVPSRNGQNNGGFHNFPRFIERWGAATNLIISGSFIQLNFSTYATAPFEQKAWEPGIDPTTIPDDPNSPRYINYYGPPGRRWGYDVGLQYAPAGAVARRFVQPPASRSEFYRDLRADDPYMCKLRVALNRIRPNLDPASRQECSP